MHLSTTFVAAWGQAKNPMEPLLAPQHCTLLPPPLLTTTVLENQIIEQSLGTKSALPSQVLHLLDGSWQEEGGKPLL